MEAPTITTEPPKSGVGDKNCQVAVALFAAPEASFLLSQVIGNILAAGLRRSSVPIVTHVALFNSAFIVAVFTVPWAGRAEAVASIKRTLADPEVFPVWMFPEPTIALERVADDWFTVQGFGTGGIQFNEAFLRPEFFEQTRYALHKFNSGRGQLVEKLLALAKQHAAQSGPGETPEETPA